MVVTVAKPIGVTGECNEEVKSSVLSRDGNRVLKTLVHIPKTSDVRGRENDTISKIAQFDVIFCVTNGVFQTAV
jgi:hypothetical protein